MRKRIERKVPVSKMFKAMTVLDRLGAEQVENESYPFDVDYTVVSAIVPIAEIDNLPSYFERI